MAQARARLQFTGNASGVENLNDLAGNAQAFVVLIPDQDITAHAGQVMCLQRRG